MTFRTFFYDTQTKRFKRKWLSLKRGVLSNLIPYTVSAGIVFNQAIFPSTAAADTASVAWLRSTDRGIEASSARAAVPSDAAIGESDPLVKMIDDYGLTLQSVDQLALQFGTDPEAAFKYVRDRIRTEPYAGSLRAPSSVIAASGGGLQDKSELLMVLLRKMGLDARIAQAPMTDEIADRLRSGSCAMSLTPDPHIPQLLGLTPQATDLTIQRAQRDYGSLLNAASDDIDASGAFSNNFGTTHYWVQYRSAEGWRDLDPSVADMAAGDAFMQPAALSEGGADPHMVTIAVVTETLTGGKLREKTVLTYGIAARDAYEMPIQIGFMPAGAGLAGVLADKLGDAINLVPRIKPVFFLNWEAKIGDDFGQPGPSASASAALGSAQQEDPVTAVWIDISSIAPAGETRTARRAVVDLLSAESRQSAFIAPDAVRQPQKGLRYAQELEGVRQIIVSNGGLDPTQDAARIAYIISSWEEIMTKIDDGTIQPDSLTWMIWTRVHSIAAGAERATRDLRSADGTICAFSGHANVMTWGLAPKGVDGHITTIDWTIDGIDLTSALGEPDPQEAAAMRLWYGAVRSAVETEALAPAQESDTDALQGVVSASTLLTGPLERLTPEAVAALGAMSAQEDLDAGYILFGTLQSPTLIPAWWRISPSSGAADARLADLGNFSFSFGGNGVNARPPGSPHFVDPSIPKNLKPHASFPKTRNGANEYTIVQLVAGGMATVGGIAVVSYIAYDMYSANRASEQLRFDNPAAFE